MKRLLELDSYLTGEMPDAAADAFEDELFASPDDADVAALDRIARHGRRLVEHGTWHAGVTKGHIDKLIADGHVVQLCDAGPPGATSFAISKDVEFVCTKLALGRTDHAHVDVEITVTAHDVTKTIKDVLVDPSDGSIYGLCERPLAELAFGQVSVVRVRATTGRREQLAEWNLVGQLAP